MDIELFDYPLPAERIAQQPLPERDQSRLLVVHRNDGSIEHRQFRDLGDYLGDRDLLIRNNATVLPSRLLASRPTGGKVECLLSRPTADPLEWICLLRPGRKLASGSPFGVENEYEAHVEAALDDGTYRVRFALHRTASVVELARKLGIMPLPPYIERSEKDPRASSDVERYQTVYAQRDKPVAAAAPTAGLHFTPNLLDHLAARGTRFSDVTLHVGLGTFKPIQTARIEDHTIHRELYEIPPQTANVVMHPDGRRRVAVGTTVVRSLEDFLSRQSSPTPPEQAWIAEAGIYIHPPFKFQGVDALITNFHQPRSTLLCLVAAFLSPGTCAGVEHLHRIYREALAREYRFLSYGDAMLIL